MIINSIKKGKPIAKTQSSGFVELRQSAQNQNYPVIQKQAEPHEFFGQDKPINPNREFSNATFNQKFIQGRTNNDYLLAADDNDYREARTKDQLLSEQAQIDSELGKIQPMFTTKEFNNDVFQKMFQQVNGTPETNNKGLKDYEEPEALVSSLQPFTEIDEDHKVKSTAQLSSLGFSGFVDGFKGSVNPNQVDKSLLTKLAQQPSITDVNTIEDGYHTKMKQRLNDYQNINVNVHPKPENPNQLPDSLRAINSTIDKISEKELQDTLSRKLMDRNHLTQSLKFGPQLETLPPPPKPRIGQEMPDRRLPLPQQGHRALPVMDYPRNSNLGAERDFGNGGGGNANLMAPAGASVGVSTRSRNEPTGSFRQGGAPPQQQGQGQFRQGVENYFAKIPSATQNPQQIYGNQVQQLPSFAPPMMPIQMPNMGYQMQNFQMPNTDFAQMQKKLQDMEKLINKQNTVIKKLESKSTVKPKTKVQMKK
jgi:hypothetical protein